MVAANISKTCLIANSTVIIEFLEWKGSSEEIGCQQMVNNKLL